MRYLLPVPYLSQPTDLRDGQATTSPAPRSARPFKHQAYGLVLKALSVNPSQSRARCAQNDALA